MNRPYFEETQYLRHTRWVWFIIIPSGFLSLIPLIHWYDQAILSNQSTSTELLVTSLLSLAGVGFVVIVLMLIKLDTRIDNTGIHFRFFPNKPRWNHIRKEDVEETQVRNKRNILTTGIIGYHRNVFQKTVSMTIRGNDHLWIRTKNNRKFLIGTQHPGDLERAIRRLFTTEENF